MALRLSSDPTRCRLRLAVAVVAAVVALARGAAADERVTIELIGGRTFTGLVDARTSDQRLWLRFEKGAIVVRRPFDWAILAGAEIEGQSLSAAQLRVRVVVDPPAASEVVPLPPAEPARVRPATGDRTARPATLGQQPADSFGPVTSIRLDATVANWDQDVESDGLLVNVYPLDAFGNLVPVAGSIDFDLVGEGPQTAAYRETFPILGRWVWQLAPRDLTVRGYVFRLEFSQHLHPEFNLQIGPVGEVHARLIVPGTGIFEASTNTTNLRPVNPLRDRLQVQQGGSRFFPWERTGQGKQD